MATQNTTSTIGLAYGSWFWANPNTSAFGNAAPIVGSVAPIQHVVSNTRTWTENTRKDWRELIRLGVEAGTNHSASGTVWSVKGLKVVIPGTITRLSNGAKINGQITFQGSMDRSSINWSAISNHSNLWQSVGVAQQVEREARMKFYQQRLSVQRRFMSGVTMGEFRETVRMFRRPMSGMSQLINHHVRRAARAARGKRGKRVTETSWSTAVNDSWLTTQYGLMPLVSEVEDLAGLISDPFRWPVEDLRGASKRVLKAQHSQTSVQMLGTTFSPGVIWVGDETETISVRYMGALRYRPDVVQDSQKKWGLGPQDFFPTVWNLIPYSFLVDYFSSIGGVIDGISHGPLSLDWGCRVAKRTSVIGWRFETTSKTYTYNGLSNVYRVEAPFKSDGHVFSKTRYEYTRSVINKVDVGFSDIYLRLPRGDTAWRKWTNVGALAAARFLPPVLRQKLIR